jgi:hypothetical protein
VTEFDDLEKNETVELSAETQMNAYEMAWDEFVGHDRDVSDIRVSDAYVDGDDVVVEVSGDVTKRDPKEIPVFQSQERWESRSDTEATPLPLWMKVVEKSAPFALTGGVLAVSGFVAVSVMEELDMSINGTEVAVPGYFELTFVMATILFVIWSIQYLPRVFRGGFT